MKRESLYEFIAEIIAWLIVFFLAQYLINGSFWLHFFLASACTGSMDLYIQNRKLKEKLEILNDNFQISDRKTQELLETSDEQRKQIDKIESELNETMHYAAELQKNVVTGKYIKPTIKSKQKEVK